jgi:hypothetical protein
MSELAAEILRSGRIVGTDGSEHRLDSYVSEREGRFLQSLARRAGPQRSSHSE